MDTRCPLRDTWLRIPGKFELSAACDIQPGRALRFCEKYGFARAYSDIDEMLAREKLDGCIAVVPMERIAEVGVKLLLLRMPCVVEKPLGSSIGEVTALVNAARETLTPNMVSVNRRFMPFLNNALTWTRAAGPLRYVYARLLRHARTEPEFLWTTAVHAVDALRYVVGELATAQIRALGKGGTIWYGIDIQFENGVEEGLMFCRLLECSKRAMN